MWILAADGDTFKGTPWKRFWAKPGKKYLFGRVRKEDSIAVIESVTVSRKHLTLEVLPVKPDYCARATKKTRVFVTDLNTKCGSRLNGKPIRNQTVELEGNGPFMLQVGRYEDIFTIQWIDVVLSLDVSSVLSKSHTRGTDSDASEDPSVRGRFIESDPQYIDLRAKLTPADVKLILDYLPGVTTHVLQTQRNSKWTLQALIDGVHIVSPAFVDAIAYATTPANVEDPYSHCPMEDDFDGSFPLPDFYLPAKTNDELAIPDIAMMKDQKRRNMFEGYTFVFTDERRFTELLPAITTGHGKAVLFEVQKGHISGREVADYMRSLAERKGVQLDRDSKIALVELDKADADTAAWAYKTEKGIMRLTGLKPIKPTDFLRAAITSDSNILLQTIETERVEETPEPEVTRLEMSPVAQSNVSDERDYTSASAQLKRPREIDGRDFLPRQGKASQSESPDYHTPLLQSQSHVGETISSPRPRKRPRVREFKSRANTFALDDDDEEFAPPPGAQEDTELLLDAIGETPVQEKSPSISISNPNEFTAATTTTVAPLPEDTSILEEGVTTLLPGAEAMKTHAVSEKHRPRRRTSPSISSRQSDDEELQEARQTAARGSTSTAVTTRKRAQVRAAQQGIGELAASTTSPRRSKRQKTVASRDLEDEEMIRAARQRREQQDREFEQRKREEETPFVRRGDSAALPSQQRERDQQDQKTGAVLVEAGAPALQPSGEELGITTEQIQRLVIVEEMEVPERSSSRFQSAKFGNTFVDSRDGLSKRWDPRWNGRRNFKKFKRSKR
ncbi:hypothetical protein KEM54_000864, partial [Ascosphaera aggregata]